TRILPGRVPYIARLRIKHFGQLLPLATAEFVRERRCVRRNRFILAIGKNERVVAGPARRPGRRRRQPQGRRRSWRAAALVNRCSAEESSIRLSDGPYS